MRRLQFEIMNDENKNIVIAHQEASISVPVTITPKVNTKEATLHYYGDPIIKEKSLKCIYCHKTFTRLVLSQNIRVEIPIELAADAIVKNACIEESI